MSDSGYACLIYFNFPISFECSPFQPRTPICQIRSKGYRCIDAILNVWPNVYSSNSLTRSPSYTTSLRVVNYSMAEWDFTRKVKNSLTVLSTSIYGSYTTLRVVWHTNISTILISIFIVDDHLDRIRFYLLASGAAKDVT